MRIMIFLAGITVFFLLTGCTPDQINQLDVRHGRYVPDTVYFKVSLDTTDLEDARRARFEIPWETGTLEGVEGGFPREYWIVRIECEEKNRTAAQQFTMGYGGRVWLPTYHQVPIGAYTFDIGVSNEKGKNKEVLKGVVTIIIE